jgi:predicted aspartyl protease
VVRLASVQIGAQRRTNVEAVVLPLPAALRVDGLLGVNVLEQFRTTFEFAQTTLVLR